MQVGHLTLQLNKVDAVIDFVDALTNGNTSADGSVWSKVKGLIEVMVGLKIEVPCKVEKLCFGLRVYESAHRVAKQGGTFMGALERSIGLINAFTPDVLHELTTNDASFSQQPAEERFDALNPRLSALTMTAVGKLMVAKEVLLNDVIARLAAFGGEGPRGLVTIVGKVIALYEYHCECLESPPAIFSDTVKACHLFQTLGDLNLTSPRFDILEQADAEFMEGAETTLAQCRIIVK